MLLKRHHALLAQLCAQHAPCDKGAGGRLTPEWAKFLVKRAIPE
jgi:hypothetical protein